MITKIFGPPGSGKTTFLLNTVERELADVHPTMVGYFAFTRKAATEARDRAMVKFPDLNSELDFPWFRTLHSLAYRCLGVNNKDMMSPQHFSDFAKLSGLEIATSIEDDQHVVRADNPILNQINLARIRGEDLRVHYNRSDMDIEWFHFEYVERAYRKYKEKHLLLDFTDLLERIVEDSKRLPVLDVLIVDEAQDLSLLQWRLVMELASRAKRSYIAGDDDQAVYTWAGADVESFLSCEGEVKILQQSYRVPAKVHSLANNIVHRIQKRQQKVWAPKDDAGSIAYYNDYQSVDVTKGEWLIMASTNYMLNEMHNWLKGQGLLFERHGHRSVADSILSAVVGWERLRRGDAINHGVLKNVYKYMASDLIRRGFKTLKNADSEALYTMKDLEENHGLLAGDHVWHEVLTRIGEDKREYLIAVLRRGTKLGTKPLISLSTIHGAKGGEADNVLLMTDLSPRFAKDYARNADDINRLLYVGVTRTREALHIVLPKNEERGFRF